MMSGVASIDPPEVQAAIRAMGTNVIPFLLIGFGAKILLSKQKLIALSKKQSLLRVEFTLDRDISYRA